MRQILGVLSKEMIESIVENRPRLSQGEIVSVQSFLEEEACLVITTRIVVRANY